MDDNKVVDATNTTEDQAATPVEPTEAPAVEDDSAAEAVVDADNEDATVNADDTPANNLPGFRAGDTVRVHYKIIEGNNSRVQPFEGIVICRHGSDVSKTFTVRKIGADSVGVERIFPLTSPNIDKIDVIKRGKVRRAKLYYLRDKVGRAAMKVKELKK